MNYRKIISLFLIELIILLPIAIAESLDDDSADTLFVDTNIPDSYTSNILDVRGMTFASARVSLYVNDAVPRELTAADGGSFVFPDVVLDEGSNTIRVVVKSGLDIVEESYSVMVDTVLPIVVLTEISDVVMSEMVLINGSVNKFVNISIFVEPGDVDEVPPSKVEDLTVHSIEANLIELRWTELDLDDFKGYIIYRDGSPFATIEDINYDTYPDILVNSNIEYTYEVAAMDTAGNIGPRSDMVSATTLEGGLTNRPAPEVIDPLSELNKPMLIIETDNLFSEEVDIGAEDGFYRIKIEVVDNVGNQWVYSDGGEEGKLVLLDTEDPEIEIISPESNAEIFENYADAVTIRGRTEPGARVYLYIKRTPFGVIDDVFDVSGLADGLLEISESDIRANCRFDIEGKEQCSTHADYEAIADAEGYFELEDVDFTSMYAGAYRITLYDTGDAYYDLADHESLRDFIETNLFFLAVDAAGRKGYEQVDYEIATCWSTDYTWSSRPLPEYQSPTWLNIERLKDGTEAIYFYFNFTYLGGADDAVITNLDVSKACGSGYLEDQDNYGYSCDILGSCTEKMSPTGKTAYVACPLRAIDGIEEWTEDDWDSFIGAIEHEMSFPFKLNINYDEYNNGVVAESGKVHSLCTEVTYIVDATHINPQDILPDWLLYDFVDDLNATVAHLNDWIVKVKKVLEFAAFGCMVSFITKLAVQVYRRITCTYDEFWKKIERLGMGSDEEDLCRQCIVDNEDVDVLKKFDDKKDVQDEISDTCLKECYPSCSGAWDSESSLYSAFRWSCDRVFGHASPSGWTESATDSELFQKVSQGKGCADDQSVRGRPFRAVKCRSLEDKYRRALGTYTFGPNDKCLEITSHKNGRMIETLYRIDGPYPEGENVWTVSKVDSTSPSLEYDWVIKQNDDYYLGPLEQTCEQLCKGELTGESINVGALSVGGREFTVENPKQLSNKQEVDIEGADKEDTYEMVSGCLTPNQCVSYRSGDQRTIRLKSGEESKDVEVMTALPMGYSSNCFAPEYISSDPDERVECCCINSKQGGFSQFYQPGEVEPFDTSRHEEMEWSYRYSKIKYKNKEYNKDRYISGRDQMACFGQNHWIYDFGTSTVTGNLLIMDPMKDHLAAFQCIAISQILNRLARFKTMLSALKNCLLSIRTTGNADTGVCKELFTQYVCSFIWKIITWIRSGCLPFGKGVDFSKSDSGVLRAVSVGLSGVWDSVGDSQVELANEYGNAKLNNLLGGTEEEVFRKICLSAFGYDWEIDFENLLDIAYTAPFATLVRPVLQSREFLTIDPVSFNSIYDYRASWMISPGCDLDNYDVYLTCVTRSDMQDNGDINCAKQNDPYGRNCDCLDLSSSQAPQPEFFYQSESNIKQNELIQVDSTMIDGRIKTSPYRYDHLMFRLRVDRNMDDLGDPSQCFSEGHDDGIFYFPIIDFTGMEFAGCSLDVPSGVFSCRKGASFFYGGGTITIDGIELGDNGGDGTFNDEVITSSHPYGATYYAGEAIEGKVKFSKDEGKQCLVVRLYDKNSQPFQSGKASEMEVISLDEVGEGLVTSFRTSYNVEADDILIPTGSIDYVKEDGFSGNPRMRVVVEKHRSTLQSGTYTVEFKDTNGDNVGDEYHVIQTGAEGNIIDEDIVYLGGFAVQFIRPWVGTEGTHIYTIYTEVDESSTVNTGLTEWLLHVDVRTPKGNDDCNDVSGFEYDGSQVVVVDGTKQSFDIPILLNPNSRRSEETCADKYSIEEITKEKDCICGRSTTENCAEGSYKYCVDDMCRRYPACVSGENNEPCVCSGSGINLNEYDCAYRNDESSADFYERGDKEAKYCVDKRCVKEVGSDFVPSPTILLGESRIEETVQGASRMVFFRADSIVSVQSKFNVEIVVDGNGHDVGKVEVIIGERESVELELQPPADKKKGIWTKEVDLHNVNNMEELRFSVRATTGSKVTNSDIVGIKIVGIAE